MLRLSLIFFSLFFLTACFPEVEEDEEKEPIVNEQGEKVSDPTLRLNGLWTGQLDQAGSLRVLIYNGTFYGFDEARAFYGSVELDAETAAVEMTLDSQAYSVSDTTANQFISGGVTTGYELSGLLFPTKVEDDTLVGDYQAALTNGAFILSNDGTWDQNSSLSALKGKWQATGFELYLTQVDDKLSFREVSSSAVGCTSNGFIRLIDENYGLYQVELVERRNCAGFNVEKAEGYAALNAEGELELFIQDVGDLFYARFAKSAADTPSSDNPSAEAPSEGGGDEAGEGEGESGEGEAEEGGDASGDEGG